MIDSHAHLDMIPFWGEEKPSWDEALLEIQAVIERAKAAGVTRILNPGVAWEDLDKVMELLRFPEVVLSVGIHPHEAKSWGEDGKERLRAYFRPGVVAVGEIGLDYHYDFSPKEDMQRAFREQIQLARELNLPILVHSREAHEDTVRILTEEHAEEVGGIMHCFSGSLDLAKATMKLGFSISFSGSLTFANAHRLREVAQHIPLEKTLIETDSPYMAPPPFRGKRCEPAFVLKVAEKLAEIHDLPLETVQRVTSENARRIFRI